MPEDVTQVALFRWRTRSAPAGDPTAGRGITYWDDWGDLLMHRHEMAFTVAAPPHRVWRLLHPKVPPGAVVLRTIEHPNGSITILRDGDEHGAGLV